MRLQLPACLPARLPACLIFAAWVAEPALAQAPPFETEPQLIQWVNPLNSGPVFNGTSLSFGFPSLDYALDPATNPELSSPLWPDVSIELRLLGNQVYVPNGTIRFPANSPDVRHATFALPAKILRVSGGWTGAPGEVRPSGRPSTLSGDRGVPGVPTDNCYHVVVPFRSSYSVARDSQWLDFLIVEKGYADGPPMTLDGLGGGIMNAGGQMRLTEVTVRDCYAEFGGGICSIEATSAETGLVSPRLWARRSTFRDCFAAQNGGAIYVDRCAQVVLTNIVCRNNVAGVDGGAIWVGSRIPDHAIVNSVFHDNSASQRGGAIYVSNHFSSTAGLRILNCTIAYTSLDEDSGVAGGAGVYLEFNSAGVVPPFAPPALARTVFTNTILYANPGVSNNDNILLASPPTPPGAHLVDVSNCFIGGRATNPNTSLTVATQGYGVAFIDAALTGEVPGWVQPATRDFRLQVTSRCINQGTDLVFTPNTVGNDWMDLDGDRFYFEALNPTTGLVDQEELCREHFMGDEAWLGGNVSTREVHVPGSGSPTLPDIGQGGGQVSNAITDIGAFEYRIYQIGV